MKSIFSILVATLLLSACSKKSSEGEGEGEYYIRFKVNGVQKEYNAPIVNNNVTFFYIQEHGFYYGNISGVLELTGSAGQPAKNFMQISVKDTVQIETGKVYKLHEGVGYGGINHARILLTYADENGVTYGATLLRSSYPGVEILNEAEVTFTEITSTYAKGVFNAIAVRSTQLNDAIEITDGEFHLQVLTPQ